MKLIVKYYCPLNFDASGRAISFWGFFFLEHNRTCIPSEFMDCGFFNIMPKVAYSNIADGSIIYDGKGVGVKLYSLIKRVLVQNYIPEPIVFKGLNNSEVTLSASIAKSESHDFTPINS